MIYPGLQFEGIKSTMGGKSQSQGLPFKGSGPLYPQSESRGMRAGAMTESLFLQSGTPAHRLVPHTLEVALPSLADPFWEILDILVGR